MTDRRVVILGAGITGVLVARELLLAGFHVTVLEARHVGAGSSSRTAAGIRQQFGTPSTVAGMRYAVDFYRRFGEEVGATCLVQDGYLFLHDADEAWAAARARVAMQHAAGLAEVEALEREALRARFPWVDADAVLGGTFCPTDGFLHPSVIYVEGARRVRELGGELRTRAPVVGARHDGGRLVAVRTPDGEVEGDLFVDATNAWTARTAAVLGAEPLPVAPLKRHLWFLKRSDAMDPATLAGMPLVVAPDGVYGRPENEDTLLLGWAHGGTPEPAFADDDQDRVEPAYAHDGGVDAVPVEAWSRFARVVPAVGAFEGLVATTAGFYAVSPDHNPFLGYDRRVSNLIRLVGFSGHGAMLGPFTARVARALAEAGRDVASLALPQGEVDLGAFALDRGFHAAETMVI
jgi:sarcosine oxidase subunit beta